MENRVSKIILDLYEIKEDPIRNLEKVPMIIDQLGSLGIKYPDLARILDYRKDVAGISKPLDATESLKECVERFQSEIEFSKAEETRRLRELTRQFYNEVKKSIQFLEDQYSLLSPKIRKDNHQMIEQLLQMLIGRRIEVELIPNLLEKMGYEARTTTFKISEKVIEIDGRYEHDFCSGARKERLTKKEVVIVECKASIDLDDIRKFQAKAEMIKGKYDKDRENWNYDELVFSAWIVACYGWTDELVKEAESNRIIPITPEKLEEELKRHRIFDSRIPICPSGEST